MDEKQLKEIENRSNNPRSSDIADLIAHIRYITPNIVAKVIPTSTTNVVENKNYVFENGEIKVIP